MLKVISLNRTCGFKEAYSDSVFDGDIQTDQSVTWRSFRQGRTHHRRAAGLAKKKYTQNGDEKEK